MNNKNKKIFTGILSLILIIAIVCLFVYLHKKYEIPPIYLDPPLELIEDIELA